MTTAEEQITPTAVGADDTPDPDAVEEFVGRVLSDCGAWLATTLAMIGDRVGLWKAIAAGPATSAELAARAGIDERYAREWLAALASHGYLAHDSRSGRFALPAAHVPALAQEGGPVFFGGVHQEMLGVTTAIEPLIDAFRTGGGVPQSAYGPHFYQGLSRFTAGWFNNLLLQEWVPAMPAVESLLERGCDVADIGCGRGMALIRLAEAFPATRYTGYDQHEPSLQIARTLAAEAGVADRVRFERLDVSTGIPQEYDVITAFDVVHDAVDPAGVLTSVLQALRPDGRFVCLDINSSPDLDENAGPLGTFLYGFSVLYCMTVSLAEGGHGLGTCGFNETVAREMCADAGFSAVRRVPLENPFNVLYEISR